MIIDWRFSYWNILDKNLQTFLSWQKVILRFYSQWNASFNFKSQFIAYLSRFRGKNLFYTVVSGEKILFESQDSIKEHEYIVVIKINDVSKLNNLPFNLHVSLSAYKYPSD